MLQVTLLIILLTVVYSWEECKYVLVAIWSKLSKRNKVYHKNSDLDILISDLILLATIPLNLAFLILGSVDLPEKLFIILIELILLALILKGLGEYHRRREFTSHYEGRDRIVATIFSLAGFVSPGMRFASDVSRSTRVSKYLGMLALPLICGLVLALIVRNQGLDELQARMNILISIATLGLVLLVIIEVMEKIFRSHNWHLTSLLRIALGIMIILVLIGQ